MYLDDGDRQEIAVRRGDYNPAALAASTFSGEDQRDPQEGFMPQCQSGRWSKSSKEPLMRAMEVSDEQALLHKNGSGIGREWSTGEDSLLERENRRWQRSILA
jgi:hypothetical protein